MIKTGSVYNHSILLSCFRTFMGYKQLPESKFIYSPNFLITPNPHLHTMAIIYLQQSAFLFALLTNPSTTICQQRTTDRRRAKASPRRVGRHNILLHRARCLHTGKASADENLSERDKTHRRTAPEEKIRAE